MRLASPTQRAMRARRATTGSSGVHHRLHPARVERRAIRSGQVGERAVGPHELDVALRARRDRVTRSQACTPSTSSIESRCTPNAAELVEHRVVARPRSAGGARSTRSPGCRTPPRSTGRGSRSAAAYASAAVVARPTVHRHRRLGDEPREHVVVAVLRGAGDPEPERRGRARGARAPPRTRSRRGCSSAGSRGSAGAARRRRREAELGAGAITVAAVRVEVERVAQGHRGEAAVLELHA